MDCDFQMAKCRQAVSCETCPYLPEQLGKTGPQGEQGAPGKDGKDFTEEVALLNQTVTLMKGTVNTKMDKNEFVNILQLNGVKGALDETYFTEEFKQQMAGDTPVSPTPKPSSLTTEMHVPNSITEDLLGQQTATILSVVNGIVNVDTKLKEFQAQALTLALPSGSCKVTKAQVLDYGAADPTGSGYATAIYYDLKAATLKAYLLSRAPKNEGLLYIATIYGNTLTAPNLVPISINDKPIIDLSPVTSPGSTPDPEPTIPLRLYSFSDAREAWEHGDKFPIAIMSDSTCDGNQTTGWVSHIDNDNAAGGIGKADHKPTHAYCSVLENLLREEYNNTQLRVYNMGYSGTRAPWGNMYFSQIVGGVYMDVKMIGIGYGANDRAVENLDIKEIMDLYISDMEALIEKCYARGIQPFLVSCQYLPEAGVREAYHITRPYRTPVAVDTFIEEAKVMLANKYNLEILDIKSIMHNVVEESDVLLYDAFPDGLHGGDIAHAYEAQSLFEQLTPRVITLQGKDEQISYTNQNMTTDVFADDMTVFDSLEDVQTMHGFKCGYRVVREASVTTNVTLMDFFVYNPTGHEYTLKAYTVKATGQRVYVNSQSATITSTEQTIIKLGAGLHHIRMGSGSGTDISCLGFKLIY